MIDMSINVKFTDAVYISFSMALVSSPFDLT